MRRRLNESNAHELVDVALNISKISKKYDIDFNKLSSDISDIAERVEGSINDNNCIVMTIYDVDDNALADILVEAGISEADAHEYIYAQDSDLKTDSKEKDVKEYVEGAGRLTKKNNVSESVKAPDPKNQTKVDKSVEELDTIIKDIKDVKANELDDETAKAAIKKLKKEVASLKRYGVDPNKVAGIKSAVVKLTKKDPKIAGILSESKVEYIVDRMLAKKLSLYENVTLNGKKVSTLSDNVVLRALNDLKEKFNSAASSINESVSVKALEDLKNKRSIMDILQEELDYREYMKSVLNEEEDGQKEEKVEKPESDDVKAEEKDDKAAEGNDTKPESKTEDKAEEKAEDKKDEETEEVDLTGVVFTMANKAAAKEFIDACVDAGVPEDAFVIIEEDEKEGETEANESCSSKLNEEEEEPKKEEKKDSEEPKKEEEDDKQVDVRLVDTDYLSDVAKVLDAVYGIDKEELEKKLGGEIVTDESEEKDENKSTEDNDSDEEDDEDLITPEDIFKNI